MRTAAHVERRPMVLAIIGFLLVGGWSSRVSADGKPLTDANGDIDIVYVFDSAIKNGPEAEGLVRQGLGLVDADGKPLTDENGDLLPLVSLDGSKRGFDMKGGKGTKFKDAISEL